ncbi:MAG TPA: hypothetical protein VGV38_20635 [Pyrinomonadaceae bacterium]|nr:hypothetical protein [Pyrinomonadaceae bacterium]
MRAFHLIFGVVLFVAFLLTGQYMDRYHAHLEGMADGMRMLMRSRHIYILLAATLNLGLGAYYARRRERLRRVLQLLGSVLIAVASVLLVAAFFYEPWLPDLHTPVSREGLYMILAGTLLHVLSGLRDGAGVRAAEARGAD